jgi:hypothetical protein
LNCAASCSARVNGAQCGSKNLERVLPKLWKILQWNSLNRNQFPQDLIFMIAEAAHHHQMLRPAKGSVLLTMGHDPLSQDRTDARQFFKLDCPSPIDVDEVWI